MALKWVSFTLNGEKQNILVEATRPLLDVVRKDFGLTGTKKGCNENICGTCTMLINGKPHNTCKLPIEKLEGKDVVTIEAIGTPGKMNLIQEAFVITGASQCGYCAPGMVLSTVALLRENPHPTRNEARNAISRVLCRCTGYKKYIDAIMLAAEFMEDPEKLIKAKKECEAQLQLGKRVPQLSSAKRVCGALEFAIDVKYENICHAKVLRSPHAHAKVLGIDASEAEKENGVICVVTVKDVKGCNKIKYIDQDMRALADDKVRYPGEPVAIVVALTEDIATSALEKIKVDYEPLPVLTDPFEAMKPGAVEVLPGEFPGNMVYTQDLIQGDAEQGFKEADIIVEDDYFTPANAHAYLEPDAAIGWIDEEDRVSIYACGQAPHYHRDEIARVLGLGQDEVRVVENKTGGGFGARIDPFLQVLIALAVFKARRPVRLEFTMEENFVGYCKRHPFWIKLKTGAKKDGTLVAHYAEIVTDAGAYSLASPGVLMRAVVHSYGPFEIPNVKVVGKTVLTNNTPNSAMRGFGVSQMNFAVQMQINKIADKLGIDTLELQKKNGFKKGTITATGQHLKEPTGYKEVIETIQGHWKNCEKYTDPEKTKNLPEHIKRGKGFATTWYGIGKTGLLNLSRCITEVLPDGKVRVREGAAEIGQGVTTVMALMAVDEMNMPLNQIDMVDGDTAETPDSDITCASKHTFYTGNATLGSLRQLKKQLYKAAAKELGLPEDDFACKDGYVYSKSQKEKTISFSSLVQKGYTFRSEYEFQIPLDLLDRKTGQGELYVVFTYGATALEVEVNTKTGKVKVLDTASCFQCGKAINRLGIEGQIEGGVAMGIGYALQEEYITNKTNGFKNYRIPRANEVPDISTYVVEIPQSMGPKGAIGMGECAHFPMAPAILTALHDACGIWINELPATPEKILAALESQNEANS